MGNPRTPGMVAAFACVVTLASCAESQPGSDRAPSHTHTVIMEGMVFRPDVITVAAGDTIVWVNKDLVPHSATSTSAGFDSKVVETNRSWQTRVERAGEFDYVCSFHPMMTAKLEVR
jgi:plastocyanin